MPALKCSYCKGIFPKHELTFYGNKIKLCENHTIEDYRNKQKSKKITRGKNRTNTPPWLRKQVLKIDNRCRFCGTQQNLCVHHVYYRSQKCPYLVEPEDWPHLQSNLLTLCMDCHTIVHSNKRLYQPLCLGVIWLRSFGDHAVTIPALKKRLEMQNETT